MEEVKATHQSEDNNRYCPTWTASKKKGPPKSNYCLKSVTDHIRDSSKKKRKRTKKMFYNQCHKFNHNTEQCFLLKGPNPMARKVQDDDVDKNGDDGQVCMA